MNKYYPTIGLEIHAELKNLKKKVFVLSLFDDKIVKKFSDELAKILKPARTGGKK
jgi:Asp-tRNA(Asn)/Glu-tRNA(Gln) amidotransferase B subunit